MKTSLAVMLVVAACAAPSLAASGQDRWDGRLRSALDVNDPYYVHEGQSAARSMRFAAEEPLFCRGKQCPLTTTAAGAPKCCPSRDACCPATYDCDESDAKITRCIPTASTPPASSSSSTSSSNPEGASISVGSQPSTSSSSQQAEGAGAVQAANPAVSGSVQAPAAASSSQQVTGVQPVGAPTFSESSDPLPKFRQNIIIVKNINVLTKMQQSPDDAVKAAEESTSQQPQQGAAPVSAAAAGGAVF